jgi:hypothetical protein
MCWVVVEEEGVALAEVLSLVISSSKYHNVVTKRFESWV